MRLRWPTKVEAIQAINWIWPKLFPPFRNRVTWAVVGTGIALLTAPVWWYPIAQLILVKVLELSPPESISPWYGLLAIGIGLAYNLIAASEEARHKTKVDEEQTRHDARIYHEIRSIFSPDLIRKVLWRMNGDSCEGALLSDLARAFHLIDVVEYSYINGEMNEKLKQLKIKYTKFRNFISVSFFYRNNYIDNDVLYLYPDLNVDFSGDIKTSREYGKRQSELYQICDELEKSLDEYIKTAKIVLKDKVLFN